MSLSLVDQTEECTKMCEAQLEASKASYTADDVQALVNEFNTCHDDEETLDGDAISTAKPAVSAASPAPVTHAVTAR